MKRVLAEVTEHMEQHYSNQRYLDKLRADNDATVLLDKERQVHNHVLEKQSTMPWKND